MNTDVRRQEGNSEHPSNGDPLRLHSLFYPESVAVVGASNSMMSPGLMLMQPLITSGFKGRIYPVHRDGGEVLGFQCYKSVADIPGPVDHVIVSIPAQYTPQLMQDCVTKGVKSAGFFTAGFSETGQAEGIELENEILQIARRGGMRLVGPNCMGIYCPSSGLAFCPDLSCQSGSLGLICQSGGNAIYLARTAASRGVHLSKVISYGNACDVDESDLIEYMTHDPETKVIAIYIEGVKDGQRFIRVLNEATKVKPVLVLKGGQTESGATTVASHTGALAGSTEVWDCLFSQTGVMQVRTLDELVDAALLFTYMPVPEGRRVAIIGVGGGASVLAADDCAKAGLTLPQLSEKTQLKLQELTPTAGYMFGNPIDTQAFRVGPDEFANTIKTVGSSDEIDILLMHLAYDLMGASIDAMIELGFTKYMVETMISSAKEAKKPAAVVLHFTNLPRSYQASSEEGQLCWQAGLPVFQSFGSAAIAIDRFLKYHQK